MLRKEVSSISLDARITEDLDSLLLRCRKGTDEIDAICVLRERLSNMARIKRSPEGIKVDPFHAGDLLSENLGFEIRWTEKARRYIINRHQAQQSYPAVLEVLQRTKTASPYFARQMVSDSDLVNILDAHQVVNVAVMTVEKGFGICLFDEQGAGKTVSLIASFDILAKRDQIDQLLIVAPKSMVSEWPKDFARFREGLYRVATVTGSVQEKRAALASGSDVYVTNFETTVALETCFETLLRSRPDRSVVVVDESFFIKSADAKRTKSLRRLREWCSRAFVLCGTPAPNAPHDLVEQFSFVDFGLTFRGITLPKKRDEALPVVRRVVDERGLYVRHLKAEALPDLPEKRFHRLNLPMPSRQREIYDRLCEDLVDDLQSISDTAFRRDYVTFLARRSALLQVCSNPLSVVEGYEETPAKVLCLDNLLEHMICHRGEKVVLWSFYRTSIEVLVKRYARFGVVRYDGSVTGTVERGKAVHRFQEHDNYRLFIGNTAAAGAGLTLHRARVAIYESLSNQSAHYFQSLDRIHRRGQEREVEYFILLCSETIEAVEYERLLAKQTMAGNLLRDETPPSETRERFLADLLGAVDL